MSPYLLRDAYPQKSRRFGLGEPRHVAGKVRVLTFLRFRRKVPR